MWNAPKTPIWNIPQVNRFICTIYTFIFILYTFTPQDLETQVQKWCSYTLRREQVLHCNMAPDTQ